MTEPLADLCAQLRRCLRPLGGEIHQCHRRAACKFRLCDQCLQGCRDLGDLRLLPQHHIKSGIIIPGCRDELGASLRSEAVLSAGAIGGDLCQRLPERRHRSVCRLLGIAEHQRIVRDATDDDAVDLRQRVWCCRTAGVGVRVVDREPGDELLQAIEIDAGVERQRTHPTLVQPPSQLLRSAHRGRQRLSVEHQFVLRDTDRERGARPQHLVQRVDGLRFTARHHRMTGAVGPTPITGHVKLRQKRRQGRIAVRGDAPGRERRGCTTQNGGWHVRNGRVSPAAGHACRSGIRVGNRRKPDHPPTSEAGRLP